MGPYSLDLRQKIIDAREQQQLSIRQLAKIFGVAKSFVQKIVKQYQETGDLQPRYSRGRPPKMDSEQIVVLLQIIDENNDATLEELAELFT
jgi:putative transposase